MSQQQPFEVYPNNFNPQTFPSPSSSSSHSNGSYGKVFIVLAVIVFVSALACILGRLRSKRKHHSKPSKGDHKQHKAMPPKLEREPKQNFHFHPKDHGDIEFGFDKRIPTSKVANEFMEGAKKPSKNGAGGKGGVRFADDHIEFKPGA